MKPNKKSAAVIPSRLRQYMHFERIPVWTLLVILMVVSLQLFGTSISKDFWSHPLLNFAGEEATGYVGEKHDNSRLKGPQDRTVEVWLIAKDGSHQFYVFRVTYDYYKTIDEGSPIEVVYDPAKPERAYPVHGQDSPKWLYLLTITLLPCLVIATIVRYRRLLFRRVW